MHQKTGLATLGIAAFLCVSCSKSEPFHPPGEVNTISPDFPRYSVVSHEPTDFVFSLEGVGVTDTFAPILSVTSRNGTLVAPLPAEVRTPGGIHYRTTEVLGLGHYEVRVAVDGSVDPRAFRDGFDSRGEHVWAIPFTIGSRFCVSRAVLCAFQEPRIMSLTIVLSDTVKRIEAADLGTAVLVRWGSATAQCKPSSSLAAVGGNQLFIDCSMPPTSSGAVTINLNVQSEVGAPLVACDGNATGPLTLPFNTSSCTDYDAP